MVKQDEWEVFADEKLSEWNLNAEFSVIRPSYSKEEIAKAPELATSFDYAYVRQLSDTDDTEKFYDLYIGTADVRDYFPDMDLEKMSPEDLKSVGAMAVKKQVFDQENLPLMDLVSKGNLLERLDTLGIDVNQVVERKEDLGDFISPVVYHNQDEEEKYTIGKKISDMKPGDELTYTIQEEKEGETQIKKYHWAQVDKDNLVQLEMRPDNLTQERKYLSDYVIDNAKVFTVGNLVHYTNSWERGTNIPPKDILDIKINKDRFNEEELTAIRSGQPIDYNKVAARKEIPDKEDYLQYIIDRSQNNTWDAHNAFHETLRDKSLTNEDYREVAGKVSETERKATLTNSPVIPAICMLREAASEVKTEGLAGQDMALACTLVANGLSEGKGWFLAAKEAEDNHPAIKPYMDAVETVRDKFMDLNIDKGIENIVEKREMAWMKQIEAKEAGREQVPMKEANVSIVQAIQPKAHTQGKERS